LSSDYELTVGKLLAEKEERLKQLGKTLKITGAE
jgi:hypothetical protein